MKILKTALSGLGRIGWQYHIGNIAGNEGFYLAAVCDPLPERLNDAKEKYQANCYEDFYRMIDAEKPELTVIASPTVLHAEQAVYALEHGSDVFMDKPMACGLTEADKIISAKERNGRKLMLYQPYRLAAAKKIKELIGTKIIGEVYMVKISSCDFVFRNDWQALKKYGGGMLNNYGAHYIDMALYLSGSTASRIDCHMRKVASAGDADDVVKILIETNNNITVDIDIVMAAAIPLPKLIVYGSCGAISEIDKEDGKRYINVRYFDASEQEKKAVDDRLSAEGRLYPTSAPKNWVEQEFQADCEIGLGYYKECYEYFALGKPPLVGINESREVMRVIHECKISANWNQDIGH